MRERERGVFDKAQQTALSGRMGLEQPILGVAAYHKWQAAATQNSLKTSSD